MDKALNQKIIKSQSMIPHGFIRKKITSFSSPYRSKKTSKIYKKFDGQYHLLI